MDKKLICPWCKHEMEYSEEQMQYKDYPVLHKWFCHNCGGEIDDYEPSEDKKKLYKFYNGEVEIEPGRSNDQCLCCGHHFDQHETFLISDIKDNIDPKDDRRIYAHGPCPRCGHTKEIIDLSINDRFSYKYWNVERYLIENMKDFDINILLDLYFASNGRTIECAKKMRSSLISFSEYLHDNFLKA